MKNITEIKDCFGCGVCAASCSHGLIEFRYNEDGFLFPIIAIPDKCIGCGICTSICSFVNDVSFPKPKYSYAAWSNDKEARKQSTSGGVSFELAKTLINDGASFCGVRYNLEKQRAEHYITDEEFELKQSIGSKYIQSYTVDAFRSINRKKKTIVVGTPCQIASLRLYVQKYHCEENFLLVDFFCHGVPSILMWRKYLTENTKRLGDIKAISWRNKTFGWHNSYCINIEGTEKTFRSWSGKDNFYTLFLGNACLNKACYDNCKFKYDHSSADIRIGDLWSKQFKDNKEGVCATVVFSEAGNDALKKANLHLEEYTFEQVAKGQMRSCAKRPWYYKIVMNNIKNNRSSLSSICVIIRLINRLNVHFIRIKKSLKT